MPRRAIMDDQQGAAQPTQQPTRRKEQTKPKTEEQVEQVEEQVEEQTGPRINKKALVNKTDGQRHPITATIPVFKRAALLKLAARIKSDEALNPNAVKVSLGSVVSMISEWMADICLGDKETLAKLQAIAESNNPAHTLAEFALAFKMAQREGEVDATAQLAADLDEADAAA